MCPSRSIADNVWNCLHAEWRQTMQWISLTPEGVCGNSSLKLEHCLRLRTVCAAGNPWNIYSNKTCCFQSPSMSWIMSSSIYDVRWEVRGTLSHNTSERQIQPLEPMTLSSLGQSQRYYVFVSLVSLYRFSCRALKKREKKGVLFIQPILSVVCIACNSVLVDWV